VLTTTPHRHPYETANVKGEIALAALKTSLDSAVNEVLGLVSPDEISGYSQPSPREGSQLDGQAALSCISIRL